MELLAGHQPIPLPPPASPVNYRRVLRAVQATVDPSAAALVVTSAAPVRITLFADVSVLAEYEYREPSLDQDDRIRWFGHDVANRGNSKIMLDVPAALADPTALMCTGPSSWRTGCSESIRPPRCARRAGGCGDRARVRTTPAATLTTEGGGR